MKAPARGGAAQATPPYARRVIAANGDCRGHNDGPVIHYTNSWTEIVEREVRKQKLLRALDEAAGCWKDENHPELKKGAAAYVQELRVGSDARLPKDS